MDTRRVQFENESGLKLSARLELPMASPASHYAVFAHCFTCGKGIRAATLISRRLTQAGFGVLRFDFTGLGQSEGEFAETAFTTNVSDLVAAATFLESEYQAPALLIGHSLGGTAVIHAAAKIKSIEALCTIGAPFEAAHVLHLIEDSKEKILKQGRAKVNIGGRPFEVGAQFIKDLETHSTASLLPDLRKALLVMHSPQDKIVNIDNAAEIYQHAWHPKSFITLDGADHLLQNDEDAHYVADMIGSWVARYLPMPALPQLTTEHDVAVEIGSDGYTTEIVAGEHRLLADEPSEAGGNNMGPTPYQYLGAALGACTVMTIKMYAKRKEWKLSKAEVHISHSRTHANDAENPDAKGNKVDLFTRKLILKGDLDAEQRAKLLEIAEKCPVHRTLSEYEVQIDTELEE